MTNRAKSINPSNKRLQPAQVESICEAFAAKSLIPNVKPATPPDLSPAATAQKDCAS